MPEIVRIFRMNKEIQLAGQKTGKKRCPFLNFISKLTMFKKMSINARVHHIIIKKLRTKKNRCTTLLTRQILSDISLVPNTLNSQTLSNLLPALHSPC